MLRITGHTHTRVPTTALIERTCQVELGRWLPPAHDIVHISFRRYFRFKVTVDNGCAW